MTKIFYFKQLREAFNIYHTTRYPRNNWKVDKRWHFVNCDLSRTTSISSRVFNKQRSPRTVIHNGSFLSFKTIFSKFRILCPRAKKTYFDERIVNIGLKSHQKYTTQSLQLLNYFILIIIILPLCDQTGQSYPGSIKTRCRTGERQILVYIAWVVVRTEACHQNSWEQLKCVWSVFYPIVLNWIFVVLKVNSRSWILKKSSVSNRIKLQLRLAG